MRECQGVLELLIQNVFSTFDPMTLTLDPVTSKSIGFICYPGWVCGPSLKKVGSRVIDQKQQTFRPTDMCKAIY